jgi:hypothetical protein
MSFNDEMRMSNDEGQSACESRQRCESYKGPRFSLSLIRAHPRNSWGSSGEVRDREDSIASARGACAPRMLLRRERGDDFFEAWIAAQRVPHRTQTQVAVFCAGRNFRGDLELLDR